MKICHKRLIVMLKDYLKISSERQLWHAFFHWNDEEDWARAFLNYQRVKCLGGGGLALLLQFLRFSVVRNCLQDDSKGEEKEENAMYSALFLVLFRFFAANSTKRISITVLLTSLCSTTKLEEIRNRNEDVPQIFFLSLKLEGSSSTWRG